MQISLVQAEIESALQTYLKNIMTIPEDKKFEIEFQTTRSPAGVNAFITIVDGVKHEEVKTETKSASSENVLTKSLDSNNDSIWESKEKTVDPVPTKKKTFFANL